jgi:hypothetical protein
MEKAYDLKDLVGKLKDAGLDVAEDAAKGVVKSVLGWATESAKLSANKADDLAVSLLPLVEEYIQAQLDKIDGKAG